MASLKIMLLDDVDAFLEEQIQAKRREYLHQLAAKVNPLVCSEGGVTAAKRALFQEGREAFLSGRSAPLWAQFAEATRPPFSREYIIQVILKNVASLEDPSPLVRDAFLGK